MSVTFLPVMLMALFNSWLYHSDVYGQVPNSNDRNPDRIVNITVLQAGSNHYSKGNPGLEANFMLFETLARKASSSDPKPQLICFPEYTITGWGYPSEEVINSISEEVPGNGPWYKRYAELARETGTPLLAWIVERDGEKLFNTSFIIDGKGEFIGKYRKVHANLGEQTWWGWSQGEKFNIIELDGVKYGISICADMWFPETVRCEELLGADVILHVSIADDMGHLIPARAFDSRLPIVASIFQGGSYAVDHEGKMLGKLKPENPGFQTYQIHPFINHLGNKYGGVWETKKGAHNIRNVGAYSILTDPSTRPPWTEIFMDNKGNPQTKEQLLKRFNGRYDSHEFNQISDSTYFKWQLVELEFRGPESHSTGYPNPFAIEFDVTFTSPGGKQYLMPAFYDGDSKGNLNGSIWKVRFSADETGEWKYLTRSSNKSLDGKRGAFIVKDTASGSPAFYRWGRLEAVGKSNDNIRYLKFRDGQYWMKAGCDDPENFLGSLNSYNTIEKRKAAIDYLSSRGINSIYIITNNIDGDGKDVWPWLGENEKDAKSNSTGEVRFNIPKLEEWRVIFEYMQLKGIVVYIVLEDDSGWKGYDHEKYYREMIARFSYLPALIFNLNEEYNENYSKKEAFDLIALIKELDPFDHPCGIHNINTPDEDYIMANQIDFTSIQTGNDRTGKGPTPDEYNKLVLDWIRKCKSLSSRTLMIGIDEGRPEEDRRAWWSTYLSGGVWEAHVLAPYDRPMEAWDTIWTQLGGTRKFMESVPFWRMTPDSSIIKKGKAFCLSTPGSEYALYLPEGGDIEIKLPAGKEYQVSWWNPENSLEGVFQNFATIKGGTKKLIPPGKGDWALKIVRL